MKHLSASVILFISFIFHAAAQNIDTTLTRYARDYGQERIYLHYDKSSYAPGETIWFKLYMMQAIYPALESKTVYIDWTDENGKLLLHSLSPMQVGTSFGQFEIPDNYTGKFIHARAYTKWMLNFDSAFLYNKDIRVISDANTTSSAKNTIIPELTFFPEGGDAVAGVMNKIAFKANDQYGRPVKIKGVVKSSSGVLTDSLDALHDGMGYFFIQPKSGETFSANWEDEKKNKHVTPLPEIKNSGISLQLSISGTKRNFLISSSSATISGSNRIHLVGTMYQQPVFTVTKELVDRVAQGIIPTETLPSGILTITVFDSQWNPVAERITYINNEEYSFEPEMTVQHWGLNKRAKNEIEISVPDSMMANLSVSVTDLGIDRDTADNIITHLLLTGELKGKVNNPAYYFLSNSDSTMHQLDLVMLTHGWRRFDWEEVKQGKYPTITYQKDTAYLSVSGKVFGATSSQLRQAGEIVLLVNQKQSGTQVFTTPLSSDGSFNDKSLILFDTARIYYQLPKAKGVGDVSVQFMQNRLPAFSSNAKALGINYNHLSDTSGNRYHLQLSDALARQLKYLKGKVLATVNVTAKTKSNTELMDEKYTSGLFKGGDGYEFDLVNDPFAVSSMDIFQYLQGKVAGLQINTATSPPTLQWRGGSPTVYLDEMSTSPDMVSSVPVSDVAYIKVFRPPFMGGMGGGAGGAIAIYTRRGNDVKQEPGKGLSNNTVTGYTAIRQFYSPDYENNPPPDSEAKDLRTTLYWNPSVVTAPGKNKALLKFFNNDITDAFRVIIEGMTSDGRLAHIEQVME